jgi:Calcineurin-like phosphoesterase
MPTAIVSDLHLTVRSGADLARLEAAREPLLEELARADRVVILGDLLEMRERPLPEVLELARPFLEALGEVTAGRRLVLVPGNHDHTLAEPWLARERLDPGPLGLASEWPVARGDGAAAGRIAEWMPGTEVSLAYPGLWLREDVYATHGHYLDLHLTVPRLECIAASLLGRLTGRGRHCRSPDEYDAVLAPMYAFQFSLAQAARPETLRRGGNISRTVWSRANGDARGNGIARFLLGSVTIPGAVAALNGLGLGPFRADLSGEELRRSGLEAMATVADSLGIRAGHVIFGHTHRAGPQAGDDPADWRAAGGARLWNSGSWYHEPVFLGADPRDSPYWPGTVIRLGDEGPPELVNVLRDAPLPV